MKLHRHCPECGQRLSRRRYRVALAAHEMLGVRDRLASPRPEVRDFCREGLELARSLHEASHAGWNRERLMRQSRRWLRDAWAMASSPEGYRKPHPVRTSDRFEPEEDPTMPDTRTTVTGWQYWIEAPSGLSEAEDPVIGELVLRPVEGEDIVIGLAPGYAHGQAAQDELRRRIREVVGDAEESQEIFDSVSFVLPDLIAIRSWAPHRV